MTPVLMEFLTSDGAPLGFARVEVRLTRSDFEEENSGIIMPRLIELTTGMDGKVLQELMPCSTRYHVTVYDTVSDAALHYHFYVPTINKAEVGFLRLQDLIADDVVMSPVAYDEATLLTMLTAKATTLAAKDEALGAATRAEAASQLADDSIMATVDARNAAQTAALQAQDAAAQIAIDKQASHDSALLAEDHAAAALQSKTDAIASASASLASVTAALDQATAAANMATNAAESSTTQAAAIAQTQSHILQLEQSATTLLNTFGSFRDAYNNGDLVGEGLAIKEILTSTANLPTAGMVVGDTYLIGTVLNVWSGSVWKTSDIQGAKGEKGDQGTQGTQGDQGDKGDQGIQGIQGDKGEQGLKGDTGDKGDQGATGPANVLSVGTVTSGATPSATISGTTPNQVLSLVLQKGDKGDQGIQGIQGLKGDKGDTGAPGPAGASSLDSVTANAPLQATGSTNVNISIPKATAAADGYLDKDDFAAFAGKAPIDSPTFTGTPTAPTAASSTSSGQIATTKFVRDALGLFGIGGAAAAVPGGDINNTSIPSGFYYAGGLAGTYPTGETDTYGHLIVSREGAGVTVRQLYMDNASSKIWTRNYFPNAWGAWREIVFSDTFLNAINLKAPLNNPTFTGTVGGISKGMVGLGSVNNTADADKPVSTQQQAALNAKLDASGTAADAAKLGGIPASFHLKVSYQKPPSFFQNLSLAPGIYTNNGSGLLDQNGVTYLTGFWHVLVFAHDGGGFGAQIATELASDQGNGINAPRMYLRVASASAFSPWSPIDATKVVMHTGGALSANTNDFIVCSGSDTNIVLPALPIAGDKVTICRPLKNSPNVFIYRNGKKIHGDADDYQVDVAPITLTLRYTDDTIGWVFE